MYVLIVILFVLYLLYFHIISINREGMETNNNCNNEMEKTVYKNAGIIQNLEKSINSIMGKLENASSINERQNAQLNLMITQEDKSDKLADEADEISKLNDKKIKEIVRQAKKEGEQAKKNQEKIKRISGAGGGDFDPSKKYN